MRFCCRLFALAGFLVPVGYAQPSSPTAVQLEAFEHFADRPTTRVAWSKEIGRIETDQARAVITVLIVEDAADRAERMRGIRIDLTQGGLRDRLYTSEDHLERLIYAMEQIPTAMARSDRSQGAGAPNVCTGSEVFWLQRGHAFYASSCVYTGWSGLQVTGDAWRDEPSRYFNFTNTAPEDFTELPVAARDELEEGPL